MTAKSFAFDVGDVRCAVLLDGASIVGREGILRRYPDATEDDYRRAFAAIDLSLEEADSSLNALVMQLGDETVLVDAGEGKRPNRGYLMDSLQLAGIAPEAITRVVITHTHGDHILGLLTEAGEPTFPNATYVISREEMAFWEGRIAGPAVDQRRIVDMMERQGVRLIAMDEPIMPSLTAIPIPGHTPGQIALLLQSGSEKLIDMADLLHSPMQFAHPEWSSSFDADTSQSVPTRRALLGRAADENILALFYHLTFPGLGRVRRVGKGFSWEPLTT